MTREGAITEVVEAGSGTRQLSLRTVWLALGGLFLLNLLLRVPYFRYDFLNGDEAVRALTAIGLLDGGRLYVDVVTDKPPGATFFYAAIFALFGRSMPAVHLAATVWNFVTALIVYFAAARLYGKRTGIWAAILFVYFSTNYYTQDMMAANIELLMVGLLTLSFYLFMAARSSRGRLERTALLAGAGVINGVAVGFKQVAVFNLAFFFLFEIASRLGRLDGGAGDDSARSNPARRAAANLLAVGLGFALVLGLQALWLAETGAISGYWRNTVLLGAHYAGSLPPETWLRFMVTRTGGYVLFNAALWSLAGLAAGRSISAYIGDRKRGLPSGELTTSDAALVLWWGVSFASVFTSGRFFGHYFILALPALCMLGARGVDRLGQLLADGESRKRARLAIWLLSAATLFGFVRFHHRTAVLAYEAMTGATTRWSEAWGMSKRERETARVAEMLRERLGHGAPLYIWGYALDVYWRSGCRPASRYLTPYYVTGRFYPEATAGPWADDPFWRQARLQLIEDLERTRPRLILNVDEAILSLPYPEILEFLKKNYRYEGEIGADRLRRFLVFRLKDGSRRTDSADRR